jgi:hypothetical protein
MSRCITDACNQGRASCPTPMTCSGAVDDFDARMRLYRAMNAPIAREEADAPVSTPEQTMTWPKLALQFAFGAVLAVLVFACRPELAAVPGGCEVSADQGGACWRQQEELEQQQYEESHALRRPCRPRAVPQALHPAPLCPRAQASAHARSARRKSQSTPAPIQRLQRALSAWRTQ